MTQIDARNESLRPGTLIDLFKLDLSPIGYNVVQRFHMADYKGGSIWFGGEEYIARPIKASGFKRSSADGPPEPTLSIANIDKGGYALLRDYGELLGAKVIRMRTYSEFLDFLEDGVTPNPSADVSAQAIPEIWYVEQKAPSDRTQISFRLRSVLDIRDKKFPGRLILKNVCRREYRWYDPVLGVFKYSSVNACPYAGTSYFKRDGTSTLLASEDDCGKDFGSCFQRFGNTALPGWFFPGVRRVPSNG